MNKQNKLKYEQMKRFEFREKISSDTHEHVTAVIRHFQITTKPSGNCRFPKPI